MNNLAYAKNSYVSTGKEARVLSANAHQLISILLEELVNLLDEISLIHSRGDTDGAVDQQVMALSIIDSLLVSLDMEKGGELAINLRLIYSQVRKLVAANHPAPQLSNNRAAHKVISEIYSAWSQIG